MVFFEVALAVKVNISSQPSFFPSVSFFRPSNKDVSVTY